MRSIGNDRPNKPLSGALLAVLLGFSPAGAYSAQWSRSEPNRFSPPVTPACVSSPFGPRILPNRPQAGTFHEGIDLPAPIGSPVTAVGPGTVIRIQHNGIGGLEMLVQHAGFIGVYSHLGLIAPLFAEGRKTIDGGERIGTVGHTGLTFGPHLYFGMIVNGRAVDPVPYLKVASCGADNVASGDKRIKATRVFTRD